jgi:cell division protein FtsN
MEEREVRLPVTDQPPPEGQRPKEAKEFPSFYQALPSGDRPGPIDVARGAIGTAPGGTAPAGGVAAGNPPPTTTPTTTAARPTTTVSTGATVPHAAPQASTTTPPPRPVPTSTLRTATTPPPPVPATTIPAAPPASLPRQSAHGGYTVEASPTRSRAEAEQLQATLQKRGYDAKLIAVQRDGDTWYRLRVGRYATAEQANEVMRKLRDSEGVTHAFVESE